MKLSPFYIDGPESISFSGGRTSAIEIDEGYFEIACKRIRDAYAQPDMFVAPAEASPKQIGMFEVAS